MEAKSIQGKSPEERNSTSICGWNPIGSFKTVTKSREGIISEIDDIPALNLTLKYAGLKELPEDFGEAVTLVLRTVAMQFPNEKGEAVTLVGLINKDERFMATHRDIPACTKIQFALPPEFEIIDEAIERCKDLKSDLGKADVIFRYCCAAKLDTISPLLNNDLEDINKSFDISIAGFFYNGEIGRTKNGDPDTHNCATF